MLLILVLEIWLKVLKTNKISNYQMSAEELLRLQGIKKVIPQQDLKIF